MNTSMIIDILPEVASLVMAIVLIIFTKKILPLFKTNSDDSQIKTVKQWANFFVESAERLELAGKLNDVTKKEYVMNKLIEVVAMNGYTFTEEQLDDIRRAAVIVYESTYGMVKLAISALLSGAENEKA